MDGRLGLASETATGQPQLLQRYIYIRAPSRAVDDRPAGRGARALLFGSIGKGQRDQAQQPYHLLLADERSSMIQTSLVKFVLHGKCVYTILWLYCTGLLPPPASATAYMLLLLACMQTQCNAMRAEREAHLDEIPSGVVLQ